ncbi:MAG TPA: PLP-dependent aspartate aminotransferase family protein [Longimicrobiales bacterium]|nr:PLP-dependent aspartate aminotransferase family protein [Longimicrobiales bacterium]
MKHDDDVYWHIDTTCIHAGVEADPALFGSVAPPLFQTSTFAFRSAEQGAARFAGEEAGYTYTRLGNPTTAMLETSIAALEEGSSALATATGMAAVSTVFFALLSAGDHVVCGNSIYGPSRMVLERDFTRFGVQVTIVDTTDLEQVRAAMTPRTRLLYIESPANPTLAITDLAAAARIAHDAGALLVVDNTFMSPILQKPFRFGADIVLHSVTKFLNGHSDVVGGVLVFRDDALMQRVRKVLQYLGGTMDPHQAWLVLRGIKTLAMRVRSAQQNAGAVAALLAEHPAAQMVAYPGNPDHPQAELIARQMAGPGSLISFELKGGIAAGRRLLASVRLPALAVSLGGVESLIQHPASMTHAGVAPAERLAAGITDGLVRLSVGCEDCDDLVEDMRQALDAVLATEAADALAVV